jgi:hypothetical protein
MPKEEQKEKEGGDSQNSEPDEAENTLEKNLKIAGENGAANAEILQPNQQNSEHQYDANGDMIKKKRGRKPKSYY